MRRGQLPRISPVQSEVLIIYVLLMVTKTATTTDNMEKIVPVNANQYPKTNSTSYKYILSREKLYQIGTLQRIWNNIRYARERIKKQSDFLRNFYAKVREILSGHILYEWLPKEHFQFFENEIRHLEKHKKVSRMIPILYNSLDIFITTFEELLLYDGRSQQVFEISVYDKRNEILRQIFSDLKTTLIEVKGGIQIFKIKVRKTNITEVKNMWRWESKLDNSSVMLRDWGVITVYYRFIKDWEKITKELFENYCNMASNLHKCHRMLKIKTDVT